MRINLIPYKLGSESCKNLQAALQARGVKCLRVRYNSPTYKPRKNTLHVIWGNVPEQSWSCWYINLNSSIATNKLTAFKVMKDAGVSVPEFTTNPFQCAEWVNEGHVVVVRHHLNGHSGSGIELIGGDFSHVVTQAPLYVKYKKKRAEYRVHVFNGTVIDVQQKKRRREEEVASTYIRNSANGWVFCREGIEPPEDVLNQATKAVAALGLMFGAVDVIWNEYEQKAYVLEVNTAPGLEGTTVEKYADAILEYYNEN